MREQVQFLYWGAQAPLRSMFFLLLCAWSYSSRPGGPYVSRIEALKLGSLPGANEGTGSGIVLAWAFLEMMAWFWIWIVIREERKEVMARVSQYEEAEQHRSL